MKKKKKGRKKKGADEMSVRNVEYEICGGASGKCLHHGYRQVAGLSVWGSLFLPGLCLI